MENSYLGEPIPLEKEPLERLRGLNFRLARAEKEKIELADCNGYCFSCEASPSCPMLKDTSLYFL